MTPAQFNELQRQADAIEQHKKWKESKDMALQKQAESKAIPELSDEEIEEAYYYFENNTIYESHSWESVWKEAIKWYREQLKSRQ